MSPAISRILAAIRIKPLGRNRRLVSSEHSAAFLRSLLAASEDCIKVLSLEGALLFMSEGGRTAMEVSDFNLLRGCRWTMFWQGEARVRAASSLRLVRHGKSARFQGSAQTFAGVLRHWDVQLSPIYDETGAVGNVLIVSRDITKLKEAEERHLLLAMELKHRMKNVLAIVQSIANQTFKGSTQLHILSNRLSALAGAQDLLTRTDQPEVVRLSEILETALTPHDDGNRFLISGNDVVLPSHCALGLILAVNELATNASKYGALSKPEGRVRVNWSNSDDGFRFRWAEDGGPVVVPPTKKGFGSRMIDQAVSSSFRGTSRTSFEPQGLVFEIEAGPVCAALDGMAHRSSSFDGSDASQLC